MDVMGTPVGMFPKKPTHVLIVGGGYVGMYTALRLQRKLRSDIKRGEVEITVIDEADAAAGIKWAAEVIAAGVAVVLVAVFGRRVNGGDVAIFVIGLLVLSVFISPGIGPGPSGSERITHSAARSAVSAHQGDLLASAEPGSISASYTCLL